MIVVRHSDWMVRWDRFVMARMHQPFEWGVNDCALYAADAVEAMTGTRLCPELHGSRDARRAMRTARSLGGLEGIARRALGEPVLPTLARVGDVVLLRLGKREWLGVCNGQTFLAPGRRGTEAGQMRLAVAAWRVG